MLDNQKKIIIVNFVIVFIIVLLFVLIKLIVFKVVKKSDYTNIDADYRLSQPVVTSNKSIKECNELIPYVPYNVNEYSMLKDTIFVSIASYRDSECSDTLVSLCKNARYPNRVYVGICEQNKMGYDKEACISNNQILKKLGNISVHKIDYKGAKGPTYARYFCSRLWSGQEYYFQIDSHTKFEKDWDINLIHMLKQCKETSSKPVLSAYPSTDEQLKSDGIPVMDSVSVGTNGLPVFFAGFWKNYKSDKPVKSPKPFIAAGFMFLESSFLNSVPYDPYLSGLFQGEETLFSARLYTNGYDVYAPNIKVCSHHYNRQGPMYYNDMPDFVYCKDMSEKKVLYMLGLLSKKEVDSSFLDDITYYGLGQQRTLDEFWKASGLVVKNGKLIKK